MIKTTKIYIVVFISFVLAQTSGFAQYNGGSGDGAHTDPLSLTSCSNPPHFYAYFGGTGDGANTDLLTNTACGSPPHFFAYMGGVADGAIVDLLTLTACATPPSQFFAYMGGSQDGAHTDLLTLTACSTPPSQFFAYMGGQSDGAGIDNLTLTACSTPPSQFYAYFGGIADGAAKDTFVVCPRVPPVANFTANATVCAGATVTFTDLTTNMPNTWGWTFPGGTPGTSTVQNPVIVYNTPGVYNVTLIATNANGSNTLTMTGYITVNAIPVADAGINVAICNGSSTTFSATGGTTYSWLPATGLSSTSIANPIASPTLTTTYTVNATTNGCSKTAAVTVTVNPLPTANAGADVAICNGSSTTFTASVGTSYSWIPATALSSTTSANPVANPTVTTNYTVTVTNAGCFATDVITVTVNSLPTANAGTNVTICNGTSTTLGASGGSSYNWLPATGLSSTTIFNPVASPTTTTNYTVSVSNGTCSANGVVTVSVTPLPNADAGINVAICNGSSTTFSATGGTTYSWLPATGLSSTTIANPIANPTITTTYTVNATANGCSKTAAVTVTVNPLPTANAGADVAICNGSSTTFTASGGTSYSWIPATALSSTTSANPVANPTVTTNYTVTVTNAGCFATDVITVTVNSLPTANAGTNVTICNGTSTTLGASGGSSYNWLPATGLSSTTISNPVASPTTTTNYTVSVSNGTCSANGVVTVSVTPLPNANAGSDVAICNGSSTTFSATGGTSYSWLPATGLSSATIANPIANPTITTTYTVNATANGCSKTAVVTVTVNPLPTAVAGTNTAICNGLSTTLNASGGSAYSWSPATGLSAANIFNPVASPTTTTIYTVTASSGGCSSTDAVTITVNALPIATVSASGSTTFCAGNNVILTSSPGSSYAWSNGAVTQSISATTSGNYSVTVTNASGCSATSGITNVIVNTPGVATISLSGSTTFCNGGNITLTANSGSGYNWSTGATTQTINVTTTGTFSVSVADVNGCASSSASIAITVNPNPAAPVVTASGSTSLCIGDVVNLSSDAANSYLWSNGATTFSINVTTAGNYSVTNYNSFGCGTTSSGTTVTVNDPLADFTGSPLLVFTPNAVVSFSATTTGFAPYSYLWKFGDLTTSILAAPSHTYNYSSLSAYRTISLTVTDATGCAKTMTKVNYIRVEQLFPSYPMITGTTLDLTGVSFVNPVLGIISMADGNCLISVDSGKVWNPLPTGNTQPLTGASALPGKWFVTGNNGTILMSTNNGTNWTPFTTGTTETFNGSSFSSLSNGFAVGTNGTIQKYDGISWTPETSGTPQHLRNVYALSNGNAIAVGENQTILSYNGASWSAQTSPLIFNVKDVRFSSLVKGYAAGTNGIILQTVDAGANWLPSLTGVDINFNSIEVQGPDTAWATGTNGIVYRTIDNGANWIRYSVGYTDNQAQLRVSGGGKGHVVGQGGHGRYFKSDSAGTITGIRTINSSLESMSIYPNPARDYFTISNYFTGTEKVIIELKDAQARLVKRIVNTDLSGEYFEKISTEYYSPGIYFIHIQIGDKSMVKKLIIMK